MKIFKDAILYLKLLRASLTIIRDPLKINRILEISHSLHERFDSGISLQFYSSDKETVEALTKKPLPLPLPVDKMEALPKSTLGGALLAFLKDEKVDPNDLIAFKHLDTNDLNQYILEHQIESHDIWHVVTGFGTDVASELGLQGFYAAQNPSLFPPLIIVLGLLNGILFNRSDLDRRMHAITLGFVMGKKAKALFGRDWQNLWAIPLDEIRQNLNINTKNSLLSA